MTEAKANRKQIKFDYINFNGKCNLETEHKKWGCCCLCLFHEKVYAHCCHSPGNIYEPLTKSEDCVCNEWLGFWICLPPEMNRASLSGKHGCCELYQARKVKNDKSNS